MDCFHFWLYTFATGSSALHRQSYIHHHQHQHHEVDEDNDDDDDLLFAIASAHQSLTTIITSTFHVKAALSFLHEESLIFCYLTRFTSLRRRWITYENCFSSVTIFRFPGVWLTSSMAMLPEIIHAKTKPHLFLDGKETCDVKWPNAQSRAMTTIFTWLVNNDSLCRITD